jgi:hypothetical protein
MTAKIIDDPNASDIYVNKTIGVGYDGATISLTLGCTRVLPERLGATPPQNEPVPVHVVGRLALTPAAAVELANALNGILGEIAKKSANPAPGPGKPN